MNKPTHSFLFILIGLLFITQPATEAFSASPYPPSPIIQGITWDQSTFLRTAPGSDIWVPTWASDGNLYTSWGDGGGFGGTNWDGRVSLGVGRIVGSPENFIGQNVWGGKDSENSATFDGKTGGLLSVNGILYMLRGPGSEWNATATTNLAWSNNLGASWQLSSEVFFRMSTEGFGAPAFLNFGQDYEGARDNFVYIYSTDYSGGTSGPFVDLILARVPKDQIKNRGAYEFLKGLDGNGNPLWTKDSSLRKPIFSDPTGGAWAPSVSYNPGIKRYLMVVPHGYPRQYPFGGLGIFDAPEPWGPWTTVYYDTSFFGSTTLFAGYIPTKWISADGKNFYLVYSGYGSVAQDAYQHIKGRLALFGSSTDTTPPDPPQNVQATVQ